MTVLLTALFALVFFAPLSFIYGRKVAARIHREARARGRSLLVVGLPKLVLPAILGPAMLYRLAGPGTSLEPRDMATGSPTIDAGLSILFSIGSLAAILFFLVIPFVLGRLFGVAAALAGRFEGADENVLSFGAGEGRTATADPPGRAEEGPAMPRPLPAAPLTIAIDGPAAAGKGTLAKRLAAHYALPYLDTGLLYRAVGRKAAEGGADLDDPQAIGEVARRLSPSALDDGTLRGREAGELASRVAVHPPVRAALVDFQREFAGRAIGAVLDGRDIGTVICPQARVKFFVTASPEVRARRRTDELAAKGREVNYERILTEVRERDRRDAGRAEAPLKAAPDAHLLDTSEMDIEAAFRAACAIVDRVLSAGTEPDARLPA